jgi:hypothetical protein
MQTKKTTKKTAQAAQPAQAAQFSPQSLTNFMQNFAPQLSPIFIKYGTSSHTYIFYAITPANLQAIQANLTNHLQHPIFAHNAANLTTYFAKHLQSKLNTATAANLPLLLMLSPTTKQAFLFNLSTAPSWGLQYIHPSANFLIPQTA